MKTYRVTVTADAKADLKRYRVYLTEEGCSLMRRAIAIRKKLYVRDMGTEWEDSLIFADEHGLPRKAAYYRENY